MSCIEEYYNTYLTEIDKFNSFHNQVINMPRDEFSETDIQKIQTIAYYLLLTERFVDSTGNNYKEIMKIMSDNLRNSNISSPFRDSEFEERYLSFSNIDTHYEIQGRMFRHVMGTAAFFGMIKSSSRQKKLIDFNKCKEYLMASEKNLIGICRNNILNINIKDNDYIASQQGIVINTDIADYRPAHAILNYIKSINRPATLFEISILLGRIDDVQTEKEVLERALAIGSLLPSNEEEQINIFFRDMNWINSSGERYNYAASQEPHFKFKRFILFMINFGLLQYDRTDIHLLVLTEYANELISSDIPDYIVDLDHLITEVEEDETYDEITENELSELILYQRNQQFLQAIRENEDLVEKINIRVLRNPKIINGKRQRNKIISELAKILAGYKCQYADRRTFKMPNGKYYVETHHIIEFANENGPDITDNLIVLGPEPHKLIHHAIKEEVDDLYRCLVDKNAIQIDRFRKMHNYYGCLTIDYVEILFRRKIINSIQKDELINLINQ